jgi:hypothetical protein
MTSSLQDQRFSSRRRFLQRTLSGVAGWALWHGWPSQHRALAQTGAPAGQMTWAMHITHAALAARLPVCHRPPGGGLRLGPESRLYLLGPL